MFHFAVNRETARVEVLRWYRVQVVAVAKALNRDGPGNGVDAKRLNKLAVKVPVTVGGVLFRQCGGVSSYGGRAPKRY